MLGTMYTVAVRREQVTDKTAGLKHKKKQPCTPASIFFINLSRAAGPVSYPEGPIAARYRFIKNASRDIASVGWPDRS